jgi:hypothetical protein
MDAVLPNAEEPGAPDEALLLVAVPVAVPEVCDPLLAEEDPEEAADVDEALEVCGVEKE